MRQRTRRPNANFTEEQKDQMIKLKESGLSFTQVGKHFGVSGYFIKNALRPQRAMKDGIFSYEKFGEPF